MTTKKTTALLLGISLLTGCGCEMLHQAEPPSDVTGSAYLGAHCTILEGSAIVQKPFESGVYTSEAEWRRAVKECGIGELEAVAERYDSSFFTSNSLACLATCSSGGKNYDFVSARLDHTENGTELVINASYSPMTMVNSMSGYYFLVQLDNGECPAAYSIFLNEYPRVI